MIISLIFHTFLIGYVSSQNCFSQRNFEDAFNAAFLNYENLKENLLDNDKLKISKHDPIYGHFKSSQIEPEILNLDNFATVCNSALKSLRKNKNYSREEFKICSSKIVTSKYCKPLNASCNFTETRYYRPDGQCNNRNNPLWGAANTPLIRIVPTDSFKDDIDTPLQCDLTAHELSKIGNDQKGEFDSGRQPLINNDWSVIIWQILTHEFMKTKKPQYTPEEEKAGLNCCIKDKSITDNPHCAAIGVGNSDTCYNGKVNCMHYAKNLQSFHQCDITSSPLPINFHSAFLDFELLYSTLSLKHLSRNKGLFNLDNREEMVKIVVHTDERSGQLPGLYLFVTLFAQLHNFVFIDVEKAKPSMKLEDLILEARKATTAAFQKIMIDAVNSVIIEFKDPTREDPPLGYDSKINPQVSVEFTIALRFFHYFIRDNWAIYDRNFFFNQNGLRGRRFDDISFFDILDNIDSSFSNKCGLMHGLLDSSWNIFALGNINHCHFFAKNSQQTGINLRAYDIQYGSIVGEPSYCDTFNVLKNQNFSQDCDEILRSHMSEDSISLLTSKCGGDTRNIGLTMGLDVENRNEAIGELTAIIIKNQMERTIIGDRFWYNHQNTGIFTKAQRDIVNDFSLFDLICMFHDCNTTRIQGNPFFSAGEGNTKRLCENNMKIFNVKRWFS